MMKKILLLLLLICGYANAQTDYAQRAKSDLDSRLYSDAKINATKAIEAEPTNNEARWLRVRASLTSTSQESDFKTAISDLEFLLNNGDVSEKVYKNLGLANREYAGMMYRDHQNYRTAIVHYEKAKEAYETAKIVSGDANYNYDIKDMVEYLNEVKTKVKTAKN